MSPSSQAPDATLTVAQSCGALGDLEHYAAAQIRAGKFSADQKTQIAAVQATARTLCADPSATAANPADAAQLRALVPTISAAFAKS